MLPYQVEEMIALELDRNRVRQAITILDSCTDFVDARSIYKVNCLIDLAVWEQMLDNSLQLRKDMLYGAGRDDSPIR